MSIAEKLTTVAENVPKVYEAGQKSEYDKFWDAFQDFGNRTNYSTYAFYGAGFNAGNFYPKYDIKPQGSCSHLFYAWENSKLNLKERLEECGVVLDTSKATVFAQAFNYSKFTELPIIDLSGTTTASSGIFTNNYGTLVTIEKLIIAETTPISNNWFGQYCQNLANLIVEGTIAKSGFNVQYQTKLTVASLLSILTALSKDSSIASGKSITFSTSHKSVIEGNADCLEQYNLAINAGWTIAYA